ncbi:MBL fold metallo-hydrolase [Corynebacterium rhinophilum]|jgi:possible zinc (zn2+)-dependent hydrolase|uniref:MBL fold metallo-hydrolase n=1 Tax=Corynebacterium TaxID=1716 RepID=UPI00254EA4FF|nr:MULTISPECIES: MBL fold metallo-hydrolase [unclassified Corynebacterium]MDK8452144.1 MBL fold metallo-hydrolase [Corynebacterium sp. MSK084]MDK8466539.1 MBL fold metallo-hydrolase [Corynebacterium sp. MSK130]MDK8514081.1 MBL fold metallo-hydrolase [Corynebacterium sp. MSK123]MDK8547171.1 MBL fold metallo-hydrolase [Corynebacterium sp. MSK222]MDK8687150.1 MBL fold metallo-hydrolase [Corynebacterium sp. MSK122]
MDVQGFTAGPFRTNTYIVAEGKRAFIVDPGMDSMSRVLAHDYDYEAIVLTHGHIDHTREAGDLAQKLDIPVYIHPADRFMLDSGEGVSAQVQELFQASSMVPIANLRELHGGEELELIGNTFTLQHAPGHSPGCVLIFSDTFALTGDVLFAGGMGRVDLPDSNPQAMLDSLAGPVWDLDDELDIFPGHGPTSTMREERATNPFLRKSHGVL